MEVGIAYIVLGMALHVTEIAAVITILIMLTIKDNKK